MIDYQRIADKIRAADAILVGASNGFSITEGLNLFACDDHFCRLFGDYRKKYGIQNILQGFFFQWPTEEERWAFTSRLISHYSGSYKGSPLMDALKIILGQKPYFIVTSNGENHFELAGLDPSRILEIEGSWKEMRCARGCHQTLYPTWEAAARIAKQEKDGPIPRELIPRCPKCSGPMVINLNPKESQLQAYRQFVEEYHNKNLLILELGIGARNQLIKAPLMELVRREPKAFYITFNKGEIYIPEYIRQRSAGVDGSLGDTLLKTASCLP